MFQRRKKTSALFKAAAVGSAFTVAAAASVVAGGMQEQGADDVTDEYSPVTASTVKPQKNVTYEDGTVKPNIVYIVMDDIGFSDIGVYGSEISTPNIDALVQDGLQYTNFNAQPMSSPTRASLLTGRENNSVGMGMVTAVALGEDRPSLQGHVKAEAGTVAEILKANGYSTMGIGKWHLVPQWAVNPAGPFEYWPLQQGFDRYYGFIEGETSQFKPQILEGNEMKDAPRYRWLSLE